jgi:calcium binding protein 39
MPKRPGDLVKRAVELVDKLEENKKNQDEFNKLLQQMKVVLYGTGDAEPSSEAVAQLAQEMYSAELLLLFVLHLKTMDFEGKKDVVQIFNKLLRREVGERLPTVEHIGQAKPEILTELCQGYADLIIVLSVGMMLRECVKHEPLAKIILYSDELFYKFFEYMQMSQFDLAADAFASFKDLVTKHKIVAAEFLEKSYDKFMEHYLVLLKSDNYVTKRQSLKLLGELLLDRANFTIMTKYISNPDNLKLMMNLLRDPSRNIQFEAFHVFKVFVANPNKTAEILGILMKNKEKLVKFLNDFHNDRAEDEQFTDEKEYLIKQIKEL